MKVDWGEGRFRSTFDRAVWSEPLAREVEEAVEVHGPIVDGQMIKLLEISQRQPQG